jgi:type I restriction enzyme S subunit
MMKSATWPKRKLGDLIETVSDTFRFDDQEVVFLNTSDVYDGRVLHHDFSKPQGLPGQAKKRIRRGDLLFSEIRPANRRFALVDFDADRFVVSTKLMVLRSKGEISPDYLRLVLTSQQTLDYLQRIAEHRSGTFPQITFDQVADIEIPLPSDDEQAVILKTAGVFDHKIEVNRHINQALEDLVIVALKRSYAEVSLSTLPKGWREGSLLDVAKVLSGGTPKTDRSDYWDGGILWASAKDVSQSEHSFLIATERNISRKGLDESATQMIPAFCTVIVARGATTGRMVLFGRDMAMNQTCYALQTTTATPYWLYCILKEKMAGLLKAAHGSVFDTITTSTFAKFKVPIPPQQTLQRFEVLVTPLFEKMLANTEVMQTLVKLRDALLPRILSGDIPVSALAEQGKVIS